LTDMDLAWIIFGAIVAILLFLDIGVINRRPHIIKPREAMLQVALFVGVAIAFNIGVYIWMGPTTGLEFTTGYLLELMLSVDNLFVFILIFTSFCVPRRDQHKVLFYGIIGALVFRMAFIFAGVTLVENFEWILYIFGAFLIVTAINMARGKEEKEKSPDKNILVRLFRKFMPVTGSYEGDAFFVRKPGTGAKTGKMVLWATPMFIALLVVETTDIVFAVDSIPAILGITTNAFIVYSSNVFAVLGLRSMYFALSHILGAFCYLKYGLAGILSFVGVKMLLPLAEPITGMDMHVPVILSLAVIVVILAVAIGASLLKTRGARTCPVIQRKVCPAGKDTTSCPALRSLQEKGEACEGANCPGVEKLKEDEGEH
jgi:tellurite resistance protein TerC